MNCRRCRTPLEKPGDYCLSCDAANCESVVIEFGDRRATLTMIGFEPERTGDDFDPSSLVLGETTVTAVPDDGERTATMYLRNFAGRVADEARRKRPETVYAAGERDPLREARAQLHYEFYRVPDDDPVGAVLERRGEPALATVEMPPGEKLGGSHSTLIGDRTGMKAVLTAAEHPHVKKVIPGPIDAGGQGSQSGLRAKVTRADQHGNVRLLLRDGSSVQENRVVTTAGDRETGERVRAALNEVLTDAGFGEDGHG
ncbi:metal-binding protein [Halobacteriales archaeon QS_6_71_20]|nr:MAG: metal-binding protein [Halobacteriales archaeon QS_6_71_20]